ncbi:CSPG4-like protein [Mya arenaria]|uniref:CSPG4-like protein n=1 Tax=Mya arenaria TaxID=6604 RepID=A0ABY7DUL9_MYAAR|nr:CSPG4-like protein [Mya arenaria]
MYVMSTFHSQITMKGTGLSATVAKAPTTTLDLQMLKHYDFFSVNQVDDSIKVPEWQANQCVDPAKSCLQEEQAFLISGVLDNVSFYGESYVHIPYRAGLETTDLELRFKASQPYGVLLLLVGSQDFLLLQLHAGTLQLKVNYGDAETVLDLGRHRYDDLAWHSVKVTRSANVITMVIDDSTTARERIQGDYRQLNINVGIYLGGVDSKTAAMFNHDLRFFRGTFSNVLFNTMDLVDMGRQITDPTSVKEVSWDIDPIFSAPRDSPVSFLSETSFVSFSHIHPTNERTVSFLVKTQTATALLLYSFTHVTNEKHYIALEIINHKLKLSIGKDGSIISLEAQQELRDQWHQIDITVSPTYLELVIDGIRNMKKLEEKVSAIYGGVIYVGGVNQNARAAARQDSLESLQSENGMKGGILGRLISSHCGTDSKCEGGRCGMEPPGKASVEMTPHSDSNRDEFQLLAVNPVVVGEGSQVTLSTDNIEIVYDFKQLGIRESGIMIYVVKKPKYGEIEVDLGRRRNSDVFTYLDILGKKVKYKHFGSEEVYDEVLMEVEIVASSRSTEDQFPERIQQRFDFVLPVTIRPVNDAPEIVLQNNGILRIIENTKVRISPEFLYTNDADTSPSQLTYIVIEPPNQGYFERSGRSGERITEFTQAEVNNRDIWFLHIGSGNAQVSLKVNDGHSSSDPARIFVQTVQLNLTVLKNTGLLLPQGSFCKISTENLTTVSNVPEQEVEIRYDVRRTPRYGVLERQQYANGEWQEVSSFAQRHIDNGHVRYRSLGDTDAPLSDEFSFTVTANSYSTPFSFFRIQFEQVYLKVEESKLVLLHEPYGTLTQENLHASTNNPQLLSGKIVYELIRPPSMGNFFKIQGPSGEQPKHGNLEIDGKIVDEFVYKDLILNRLEYNHKGKSSDDDYFTFTLVAKDLEVDGHFSIDVVLQSSQQPPRVINNRGLKVFVGRDRNVIKQSDLLITQSDTDPANMEYLILVLPKHGDIYVKHVKLVSEVEMTFTQTDINDGNVEYEPVEQPNYGRVELDDRKGIAIDSFTSNELARGLVSYVHDNSESKLDYFSITVSEGSPSKESEIASIYVEVEGINDEAPMIVQNLGLKVWRGSMTQITPEILSARDPDSSAEELVYRISPPTNGPSKGQFSFQVSDGVNTSPLSVFTVEAESLVLTCHTPNILHAYPNYIQPITEQQLITVDEGGEMIVAKNNLDVTEFITNLERVSMAVTVEPLVSMQPLEAPKGERVAITLHSLDASVLAERTGDNPLSKRKQGYTPSSKKSPHLRPQISGPFQIEQPHVHIEPQGRGSLDSEESKSLIVEYENTHNIPNTSRQSSEEADTIAPMIMCVPKSESAHTQPRSPDLSRTEVSSTVPTCKVTPLVSHREGEELEGAVGGCSDDQRQSLSSMGDMIDWITSDPELLEHCASSSPPELRGSKYWVKRITNLVAQVLECD